MQILSFLRSAPPPSGTLLNVYEQGTQVEVQLYSDSGKTTPVVQPVNISTADIHVYADNIRADIKLTHASYAGGFLLIPDQILWDVDQDLYVSSSPTFNTLTTTGLVNGRDIAADGTALDGAIDGKLDKNGGVVTALSEAEVVHNASTGTTVTLSFTANVVKILASAIPFTIEKGSWPTTGAGSMLVYLDASAVPTITSWTGFTFVNTVEVPTGADVVTYGLYEILQIGTEFFLFTVKEG